MQIGKYRFIENNKYCKLHSGTHTWKFVNDFQLEFHCKQHCMFEMNLVIYRVW